MFYLLLIIFVSIFGLAEAYVSVNNQQYGGKWILITWLVGCMGPWFIVSRYSDNLKFDAVLYDAVILISFWGGMVWLSGQTLVMKDYIGLVLVLLGMGIIKA